MIFWCFFERFFNIFVAPLSILQHGLMVNLEMVTIGLFFSHNLCQRHACVFARGAFLRFGKLERLKVRSEGL